MSLQFLDLDNETIRRRFKPGLPAVVVFKRRNTDEVVRRIKDGLEKNLKPAGEPVDGHEI